MTTTATLGGLHAWLSNLSEKITVVEPHPQHNCIFPLWPTVFNFQAAFWRSAIRQKNKKYRLVVWVQSSTVVWISMQLHNIWLGHLLKKFFCESFQRKKGYIMDIYLSEFFTVYFSNQLSKQKLSTYYRSVWPLCYSREAHNDDDQRHPGGAPRMPRCIVCSGWPLVGSFVQSGCRTWAAPWVMTALSRWLL